MPTRRNWHGCPLPADKWNQDQHRCDRGPTLAKIALLMTPQPRKQ
jgi:hypothetical protein